MPSARATVRVMGKGQSADAAREPRGARRKRETHEKLVVAAFRLIAERGVDAVAINEITEAADVGFGSFYNHFPSKDAIYEEVFRRVFDEFGEALDRLTGELEDPADVVAVSVRHTILRAQAEPLWGRFVLRESLTPRGLTGGLTVRLLRDVHQGIARKRFAVRDPVMATAMAGGTVMASIALQSAATHAAAPLKRLGLDTKEIAERAAATVLRGLGVGLADATRVARRRLPILDTPASALAGDPSSTARAH